jgi:hypothetical protein
MRLVHSGTADDAENMNETPPLPSDRQLVDAARSGHDAAWNELVERHEAAVRSVVPQRGRSGRRIVSQSLDELRRSLNDQTPAEGEEAIRAFRPRAIAAVTGGMYGPGSVDPAVDRIDDDRQLLATAFARLPEPWQTVIWHSHVERLKAAEVSPLVGRTVNEVTELLSTAERGLTDAYLLEYLEAGNFDDESAELIPLLSGYVRSALPALEQRRVQTHLEDDVAGHVAADGVRHHGADDSRRLIEVASTLPEALPPAIAPGITGLSLEAHRAALGTASRSFGAAQLSADRSDRVRRAVVVGSAVAVVLALVAVAYLVRQPFDNDDVDTSPTTDDVDISPTTDASGTDPGTSTSITDPQDAGDAGDSGGDSGDDSAIPPTTALDLRPTPTGPVNEIGLIIVDDAAVGFAPALDGVTASITAPAPILAGGTGTLDIVVANAGPTPFDGAVELVLPQGVQFDALADGPAVCSDGDGSPSRCALGVAPGEAAAFSVRLALASRAVGRLTVVGDAVPEPFEAQIDAVRDLVHNSVGRGDLAVIGNTVMTCDETREVEFGISCSDVLAGVGSTLNRWSVPMKLIGTPPGSGVALGSRAVLDLADDARVVHAELFWSGDVEENGVSVDAAMQGVATLVAPNGSAVAVEADDIVFGEEDATQYVGRADVTDLVAGAGPGDYLVGDIASAEVEGSYGAWALVVVTDDDTSPRRYRVVTDPFDWVAPEAPFSYAADMPVPVVNDGTGRIGVVGFEGERGFEPETLRVGGTELGGSNPFDSTIGGERDPAFDNNLGVDVDVYDLTIDSPAGTLRIEATSADDGIRLAVLGLVVDIDE